MSWEDWVVLGGVAYAIINLVCWALVAGSKKT